MKPSGARTAGVITACVLGVGFLAASSAQAEPSAQVEPAASSAVAARADRPDVTASVAAPELTLIAPTADGRFVVGVAKDQLVTYRAKPGRLREVGRSRPSDRLRFQEQDIAVHPSGRFAYVAVEPEKKSQKYAVLVYRIDGQRPTLVKTISLASTYPSKRLKVWAMAIRPDGKRLYLSVRDQLISFKMGHGKRGELLSADTGGLPYQNLAVTPDGSKLINRVRGAQSADHVEFRVWDIATSGAPVPGPVQQIDVTEFHFEDETYLGSIVPGPDSATAYVRIRPGGDEFGTVLIVKVRLADGEIIADLGDPYGPETMRDLLGRSPSGDRIYGLSYGPSKPESADGTGAFPVRVDAGLTTVEQLGQRRFALDESFAISTAGRTKGLIYTAQLRDGKRYLVSLRD